HSSPSAPSSLWARWPSASTTPGGRAKSITAGDLATYEHLTSTEESSMRTAIVWLLSAGAVLCGGRCAWAQAGRLPLPLLPGGGGRFLPHIHIPFFGHNYDLGIVLLWVFALILALLVLGAVGYHLGQALGGGWKRSKERGNGSQGQDLANPSQPEDIFCLP